MAGQAGAGGEPGGVMQEHCFQLTAGMREDILGHRKAHPQIPCRSHALMGPGKDEEEMSPLGLKRTRSLTTWLHSFDSIIQISVGSSYYINIIDAKHQSTLLEIAIPN